MWCECAAGEFVACVWGIKCGVSVQQVALLRVFGGN